MLRSTTANLLTAIGYAVAGKLSVLLVVPAGYASIIWLPAGVALAAMLILGYRALPGVFLGAMLNILWRAADENALNPLDDLVLTSAGVAIGASAQALAGTWLVHRFLTWPSALDTLRDVLRFLALGGAVACLVNSTWGPLVLSIAGRIPLSAYWDNMWTWWAGDVLGAVIITPLLLPFGAEPRGIWRSRRLSLFVPMLSVLALAVSLFVLAGARERDQIQSKFQQRAALLAGDLKEALEARLDVLQVFASLVEPRQMEDPVALDHMAARIRRVAPKVDALRHVAWIPRRALHEGGEAGSVLDRGRLVRLFPRNAGPDQPESWELMAVTPGIDSFLRLARDHDQPVITTPVEVLIGDDTRRAVLALVPVHVPGMASLEATHASPSGTPPGAPAGMGDPGRQAAAQDDLVGFALGMILLDELMGSVLPHAQLDGIAVHVHERDAAGGEVLLYEDEAAGTLVPLYRGSAERETAGWIWQVALTPTTDRLIFERSWQAPAIWFAGLLVAAVLSALLLLITGRTARAEAQVVEHAGALDRARVALAQAGFLQRLADANVVGILLMDRDGHIREANDAFLGIIGYERDDMPEEGIGWRDISPAEWKERDAAAFARADAAGAAPAQERACLRRDGSRVPVMLGIARLDDSEVAGYAAIAIDLTKVKETEAELKRQTAELENYKLIVNQGTAIVFAKEYTPGREGVYILANPSCEAISSRVGSMIGRTDFEMMPAAFAERLKEHDLQVLDSGRPLAVEEVLPDVRTGKPVHVLSTKVPLRDADGQLFAIAGIGIDITEQVQLTARLAALVDAIPDVMLRLDADGVFRDFKNHRNIPLLPGDEVAGEDVIGRNIADLPMPEEVRGLLLNSLGEAIHTGVMQQIEYSMEAGQGMRHYEARAVKSGADEVVMLLRDISEARRTREALQQANAMLQAANDELKEFASVASHDLQEPLRTVRSFVEMLERRYGDSFDERGRKWLAYIIDATQRMRALIDDLLTYSRAGRAETIGPVDVNAVVAGILADSHASIEAAGAEIEVSPLPTVSGSETELRQVFLNLISNALKFRRPDVKPHIEVRAEPDGRSGWRFSVTDNGIGIEAEYHERIFQVFQRLHGRDAYPGTGIGLALVKKIVERQGGEIAVRSTPGEGTAISFVLPAGAPMTAALHGGRAGPRGQ